VVEPERTPAQIAELLAFQERLDAIRDDVMASGTLAADLEALQARVDRFVARQERLALAWCSARRRAVKHRLEGERRPGGAIRQALIDAGIITETDRVADAVAKIRALGLPQRATVPGVEACYSGRHCVTWGFCRRCAPELAEEASRRLKETDGSSYAYAAIVNDLTNPNRTKETKR
jgi:hypothetical protein